MTRPKLAVQAAAGVVRAGLYARVSSEDQVENTSLDDQLRRDREVAERRGWTVAGEYREEGVTGTTDDRPEWQRLMADARAGLLDVVIVTKWNRLARKAVVGLKIAAELEALGVALVVIEADFDTSTPVGRMMRHMMAGFSELDRDSLVENMAFGQHAQARRGFWPSGTAAHYGYRVEGPPKAKRLVIDPDEYALLHRAADLLVDHGYTNGQVCRAFNAEGLRTRTGSLWDPRNLRRLMLDRAMVGEFLWGDTAKNASGKYGPPVLLRFDPIFTEERFAAIQVALSRRNYGHKSVTHDYPLSGRAVAPCGGTYSGVYRKDRDLRQYRCRHARWNTTGAPQCGCVRLNADELEARVWEPVSALLRDPERLLALAADYLGLRGPQLAVERDEHAAVARNVARIEKAMSGTVVDLARQGLDASVIAAAVADLQRELDAARTRLSEIEAWQADSAAASARVRDVWALAEAATVRLDTMTPAERAETLRLLDVQVTVLDNTTTPALRVEGHLATLQLLDTLTPARGNPRCEGTRRRVPRRRPAGPAACASPGARGRAT